MVLPHKNWKLGSRLFLWTLLGATTLPATTYFPDHRWAKEVSTRPHCSVEGRFVTESHELERIESARGQASLFRIYWIFAVDSIQPEFGEICGRPRSLKVAVPGGTFIHGAYHYPVGGMPPKRDTRVTFRVAQAWMRFGGKATKARKEWGLVSTLAFPGEK